MVTKPPQIVSLQELDEPKNVLVYGHPGCGKTPFGASVPKGLIIATEAGTVSARRLGYEADVWPCVDSWDEFTKAYRWLNDGGYNEYDWLVIDNATQLQESMLRAIVAKARIGNTHRDEDIPAIQDYQKWYLQFDRYVKLINAMPIATLWLAHTMIRQNEEGDDIFLPAIQGQDYRQSMMFCGRMQAIGYMEQRVVKVKDKSVFERRIQWRQTSTVFAKDRYIFEKDQNDRYTICARGEKDITTMTVISKRIDEALVKKASKRVAEKVATRPAKKAPAKKAATRPATRRRAS